MKKTISERLLIIPNKIFAGKKRQDNIPYGSHPDMVYDEFPSQHTDAPVVLFWHGGGWRSGNKEMYRFMGCMLQRLGAHAFVIGYPRFPKRTFPHFIDDAQLAIDHVRTRFPDRKIYLMGHSAGAHTALIASLTATKPVDGVISIAAPCTLAERYWYPVFGEAFRTKAHDPRSYISSKAGHTKYLLLHGAVDITVVVSDGVSMYRRLRKAGYSSSLKVLKLVDHFTILPLLGFGPLFRTRRQLEAFLKSATH